MAGPAERQPSGVDTVVPRGCHDVGGSEYDALAGTAEEDTPLEGGAAVHYLLKTKEDKEDDTGVTLGYPCG